MKDKPEKLRTALIGGLVIGVVSGIPGLNLVNCCCCAGIVLGGFLTVYLYRQEFTPEMPPLETSDALIVGVMAGVGGAFVAVTIELLIRVLFGNVGDELVRNIFGQIVERLEQSGDLPEGFGDDIRSQLEESLQESTTAFGILSSLFTSLIIYPIFSMLGGLLGYSAFRPKPAPADMVQKPPQSLS